MEGNKYVKGLLIVLAIIIVVLGGFVCYKRFFEKSSDSQEATAESIPVEINSYTVYATESQKKLSVDNSSPVLADVGFDSFSISTTGLVTLNISNANLESKYGKNYNVLSNVFSASLVEVGNAGFRTLVFVMNDGTVSFIEPVALINKREIKIVKNVGNLTDIVKVEKYSSGNYVDTITGIRAVDKKGNITDIEHLILN